MYNYGCIPTGQDATGFYLNIADGPNGASDNGQIIIGGSGNTQGIVELRTTQAGGHGLQTGQWCQIDPVNGSGYTIPWAIRGDVNTFGGYPNVPVFVTGPDTIAISWGFGNTAGSVADTVNSNAEIPVGLNFVFQSPIGNCAPIEYHCAFINRLPNADFWHNAPPLGTVHHDSSGFHFSNGQKCGTNLGPTHGVRFEFNNEWWNSGNPNTHFFLGVQSKFSAYCKSSLSIYGGYLTGGVDLGSALAAELFSAAAAFDAFKAGWVSVGRDPSQLKHYIGIQWESGGGDAQFYCQQIAATGIQCDGMLVAPYAGVQNLLNGTMVDQTIQDAYSPAGLNGDPEGGDNWPVWQLNDMLSFYVAFSVSSQNTWKSYTQWTVPAGIPLACYEGGYQGISFRGIEVIETFTAEDQMNHTSFGDAIWRYNCFEQLGDIAVNGGGSIASSYYTWGGSGGTPGVDGWKITAGPAQRPGPGLSNSFFLPQGGVGGQSAGGNTFKQTNSNNYTFGLGYAPINESPGLDAMLRWSAAAAGPAVPSTIATLSGPTSGTVNVPSANFTVTLDGTTYSGAITPSDSGGGGTFTPSSVVWSGSAQSMTFTYRATTSNTVPISITASPALSVAGSPIAYTATSPTPTPTPTPTNRAPSAAAIMVSV